MLARSLISLAAILIVALLLDRIILSKSDRPTVRKAFLLAFPVGLIPLIASSLIASQFREDSQGSVWTYDTLASVGITVGTVLVSLASIFSGVLALWPVLFKAVSVDRIPRAIAKTATGLAIGFSSGSHIFAVAAVIFRLPPYPQEGVNAADPTIVEITMSLTFAAAHLVGLAAFLSVGTWIAVINRRPILAFIATLIVTFALTFPIIFIPSAAIPTDLLPLIGFPYIIYAYYFQMLSAAILSVAGLTWIATRPSEDYVDMVDPL